MTHKAPTPPGPTEYHLRLAGNGPGARAILLHERHHTPGRDAVEPLQLLYAVALAEDPDLLPAEADVRDALAPGTAAALAQVDALYRPLDEAALTLARLPVAVFRQAVGRFEEHAQRLTPTPGRWDLAHAALATVRAGQQTTYGPGGFPHTRGYRIVWAKVALAHHLEPALP
ncbi:hypothetical protein [Streptomyces bacillaris]|uniref:hypothetical protein n=1 Tax=Streptomyces bacillaris TaxID=68179 RepID=UPI00363DF43A